MLKALASGLAIVAASAFVPASGGTLPLNPAISASDVTLVADGCGRGFRWSNRRQACVPINYGPAYVDPGYVDPNDAAAAAAAATALGVLGVVVGSGNNGYRGGNRGNFRTGNRGNNFQGGNRQNFQGGNNRVVIQGNRNVAPRSGFSGAPNAWKKPGTGIK